MKQVKLTRGSHLSQATIGVLTIFNVARNRINDEILQQVQSEPIFTLENPKRATSKDDRIPAGTYTCKPFSGAKYKNVYQVMNVPNREYILLHWGNTEKDTEGCILLGGRVGELNGQPAVLDSKKTFQRFRELIGKNEFTLIIED